MTLPTVSPATISSENAQTVNTVVTPSGFPTRAATETAVTSQSGTVDSYYMATCTSANARGCYTVAGTTTLADILEDASSVYTDGVTALGKRIEGNTPRSAQLDVPNPPRDVRTAWSEGWTGRGINLLIVDGFGVPGSRGETHGFTVAMSALEVSPGATYYALRTNSNITARIGGLLNGDGSPASANTKIDVMNLSFGSTPISLSITEEQLRARLVALADDALFKDILSRGYLTNARDAVITKSAGNESSDTSRVLENLALVLVDSTKDKVLIVGALNNYARATTTNENTDNVSSSTGIAGYSNFAGVIPAMQNRFLVEYGGTPYGETAYLCDAATPASSGCLNLQLLDNVSPFSAGIRGTSFAAPRVAGFAALVRHKFPDLTGAHTTKILLDTATTEGLRCHPNCNVEIYGQGRVSITDALSPIGKLQ